MTFKRNSRRISVGKSKLPPKEKKSKIEYDENELDGTSKESRFKIVSGQRRRNRKIRLITYGVILLMIIALIVVLLLILILIALILLKKKFSNRYKGKHER